MTWPWTRSSLSLRRRILTATVVAEIVVLASALTVYAYTLDRILLGTATAAAREQAAQVVTLIGDRGVDPEAALSRVPGQGTLMQLLDARGNVIADNDPSAADTPMTDLRPEAGTMESAQIIGVPLDEADPYAVAAVGLNPDIHRSASTLIVATPLKMETALVKRMTVVLGILGLLLSGGLLVLIDRVLARALGDVERIRASVAEISTTDRTARVPVPPGEDEITRLATTMNDLLGRMEHADSAQRAFVSNASHELRSPLTSLRAIAETSPTGIDPERTAVVAAEVFRMQRLVDDLLTLAKADDRGLPISTSDVDVDDLVLEEVHRIKASTRLTVRTDIDAARVEGDALRLSQVLHNLVDNAMRHAASAVRLGVHQDDGSVVVTVDNDGTPVPPELREAVFERFTRLHEARDRDSGGSGLGLAIVQAVVEAHGGHVTTGEAPDGWCRFEVRLPVERAQASDGTVTDNRR